MDLFMLLLIIMKLKTPIESPGVGISVTVPTNYQLGDVVRTKHLPGLICHVAVGPLVDDNVVDDDLNVHLVILQYLVLGGLTPPEEHYVTLEEILFSTSPLQNLQMLLCQHSL